MNTKSDREKTIAPEAGPIQDDRLRREAEEIALGLTEIKAGQYIDDDDLETWLDQLEIDPDAPMPEPRQAAQ
jgi:predicted transcriptional regulator